MTTRHAWLPPRGTLLISTDLHGNGDDFRALRDRFLRAARNDPDVHWAVLGDTVHGPDIESRAEHDLMRAFVRDRMTTGYLGDRQDEEGSVMAWPTRSRLEALSLSGGIPLAAHRGADFSGEFEDPDREYVRIQPHVLTPCAAPPAAARGRT